MRKIIMPLVGLAFFGLLTLGAVPNANAGVHFAIEVGPRYVQPVYYPAYYPVYETRVVPRYYEAYRYRPRFEGYEEYRGERCREREYYHGYERRHWHRGW